MRRLQASAALALLLAGTGWTLWVAGGAQFPESASAVLPAMLAASFCLWFLVTRRERAVTLRLASYSATCMACGYVAWWELVRPGTGLWRSATATENVLLPAAVAGILFFGWQLLRTVVDGVSSLLPDERRRRARSELHGKARLLERASLTRASRRRGIILGQTGPASRSPLYVHPLEGSAITLAPPRCGKGATIALNLLSPERTGFAGSTVVIDPRGELWCVASRRRRELGRRVALIDPFGVVAGHAENFPSLHLPAIRGAGYNPFDFIREGDSEAARDISVLVDALLTPPLSGSHASTRHFYESARAIIGGYIAWVRFGEPPNRRNLATLQELLSLPPAELEEFTNRVREFPRRAGGLAQFAVERQARAGKEEGGSNFSTIANQLAFMNFPELRNHTARSDFDPMAIADGNMDLFVVVPDELLDHVTGWLRLWITIPYAVAGRTSLRRNLLIVIDEMPRLGFLKPVMDGYNLAAGKGVNFWCFAQSISALDSTWGRAHRKTLTDQAEILQILGFPRTDAGGAEELSKAIGTATFQNRSESLSGTLSENRILAATLQRQAGESRSLVSGRVVPPDSLMTLEHDRQYVIAASKELPRDAMYLHHARYWNRSDARNLADPNPLVLRKEGTALS